MWSAIFGNDHAQTRNLQASSPTMTFSGTTGLLAGSFLTRRRALLLAAAAGGVTLSARYAEAVVRLDVTEGNFQPLPIAIPDFLGGVANDNDIAAGVSQIINANLKRSGMFAPIDPTAFL